MRKASTALEALNTAVSSMADDDQRMMTPAFKVACFDDLVTEIEKQRAACLTEAQKQLRDAEALVKQLGGKVKAKRVGRPVGSKNVKKAEAAASV